MGHVVVVISGQRVQHPVRRACVLLRTFPVPQAHRQAVRGIEAPARRRHPPQRHGLARVRRQDAGHALKRGCGQRAQLVDLHVRRVLGSQRRQCLSGRRGQRCRGAPGQLAHCLAQRSVVVRVGGCGSGGAGGGGAGGG